MTADSPTGDVPQQPGPHRIAFCITDLDVGGAEQCLVNVARGLDRQSWTPHVFCLSRRGALVDRLEQAGIECTCLNWRGWSDAWRILSLAQRLRRLRPVLLQTFLFHANIAGRIAGRLAGVPVIVSGIRVAEKEKHWHVRLERLTRRLVTRHVCVSQAVADFSIREAHLSPTAVTVIPNGVDINRFSAAEPYSTAELAVPSNTRWIISIGRLHPQKGHRLLIDAVAPLLHTRTQWRLMIVGDGPLRDELQQQIDRSGCRDRIVLLGFRQDIPRLLKTASLLVLPSLWEGQPNVIAEALAAGLPVVASDVEGVQLPIVHPAGDPPDAGPGLVRQETTGIIVPPGEIPALRHAIQSLLDAPATLDRLSRNTHLASRTLLTTDAMAGRYAKLYEQLLQIRCS